MEITDERKKRYHKRVVERGNAVYAFWLKHKTRSKKIVMKANEYAFDKRLTKDVSYRFQVLAFVYALSLRLERRYRGFLRKLFRLFAFLRERSALALLKRVLGFTSYTDLREIIDVESEKLSKTLSQQADDNSTGGGKVSTSGALAEDAEFQKFLDEQAVEETQIEQEIDLQTEETVTEKDAVEKQGENREKISVDEPEKYEPDGEEKEEELSQKTQEKKFDGKEVLMEKTELAGKKEEKTVEKSVANTSILAEVMMTEQAKEQEIPSPFPVFREPIGVETVDGEKSETVERKEKDDEKPVLDRNEVLLKTGGEKEQEKDPFPVQHIEGGEQSKTAQTSKEQETKTAEKKTSGESKKTMEISKENKIRRAMNVKMSEKQIKAYIEKLKVRAREVMRQEEKAWREKIAVSDGKSEIVLPKTEQTTTKTVARSKSMVAPPVPKK